MLLQLLPLPSHAQGVYRAWASPALHKAPLRLLLQLQLASLLAVLWLMLLLLASLRPV